MHLIIPNILKKLYLVCLGILLCLFTPSTPSHAQGNVLAVVSHKKPIYDNFYSFLESKLNSQKLLDKVDIAGLSDKNLQEFDFVVSVGSDASEILSRRGKINNLVSTLIPSTLAKSINKRPCLANRCTMVLIEQPIERYFQLFKSIFPGDKILAIATTSSSTQQFISNLNIIAKKYDIRLKIITIDKSKVIARSLNKQLDKSDVLLALPDPDIYNKETAKSIILSAYHKNVPIIAYSKAFSKAGALISLYSSFDDIATQTAKLVEFSHIPFEPTYYPDTFSIELNSSVAKSFNIRIDDIDKLTRLIK